MKWLRFSLVISALVLLVFHSFSYFSIDYTALRSSAKKPFERSFIEFDQNSYHQLQLLDPGQTNRSLEIRDFGRRELFFPNTRSRTRTRRK